MDLPPHIDLYIKESIDESLGLPTSLRTLESKLRASEESQRLLRQQNLSLLSKLKEKDQAIERAKVSLSIFFFILSGFRFPKLIIGSISHFFFLGLLFFLSSLKRQ